MDDRHAGASARGRRSTEGVEEVGGVAGEGALRTIGSSLYYTSAAAATTRRPERAAPPPRRRRRGPPGADEAPLAPSSPPQRRGGGERDLRRRARGGCCAHAPSAESARRRLRLSRVFSALATKRRSRRTRCALGQARWIVGGATHGRVYVPQAARRGLRSPSRRRRARCRLVARRPSRPQKRKNFRGFARRHDRRPWTTRQLCARARSRAG